MSSTTEPRNHERNDFRPGPQPARSEPHWNGASPRPWPRSFEAIVVVAMAAGLILQFVVIHVDDPDAMLYTVVARNLAADGNPFQLRFLDSYWPRFYEHPPLFFAVQAIFVKAFGTGSLAWLGALIGVGTVLVTFAIGTELVGRRAAFLGAVILVLTESFFRYQGRARLDPPLTLAFAGSVALIVTARRRAGRLCLGGLIAGAGALIKGPPALGAPIAAVLVLLSIGRIKELARPRDVLLITVSMLAPPAAFLAYDRLALDGVWLHGYVEGQVLASLTGRRLDGWTDRGYLARDLGGRFYPGVPFVFVAIFLPLLAKRWPRLGRGDIACHGEPPGRGDIACHGEPPGRGDIACHGEPSGRGDISCRGEPPRRASSSTVRRSRGIHATVIASIGARVGLLLWAALIVCGFSLGRRAWWVYAMPAYVPLALLAGAGADDLLSRLGRDGGARAFRAIVRTAAAAALLLFLLLPIRLARFAVSPCPFTDLQDRMAQILRPGERIALVMSAFDLGTLAYLVEHSGHEIIALDASKIGNLDPATRVAVVSRDQWPLPGFVEVARNKAWILARKSHRLTAARADSATMAGFVGRKTPALRAGAGPSTRAASYRSLWPGRAGPRPASQNPKAPPWGSALRARRTQSPCRACFSTLPRASFRAPRASFRTPRASFRAPRASFRAPRACFRAPRASFRAPRASFRAPRASFRAPRASFRAPRVSFRAPRAFSRLEALATRSSETFGLAERPSPVETARGGEGAR